MALTKIPDNLIPWRRAPAGQDVSFRGADAYVAHNCEFERGFLGPLLGEATWIRTYKCALRLWPDLPAHNNQALRYRLGFVDPFGIDRHSLNPHRALSEAIVTAAVFTEVIKHASWPDLVWLGLAEDRTFVYSYGSGAI
jgi:exodeoxyribonuclease X